MSRRLIESPSQFVAFLEEAELLGNWDEDITLFLASHKSMNTACCSGPREQAARASLALYRKIVDNKLEELKERLLHGAHTCGYKSITFEINENCYASKGERRNMQPYQKTIISEESDAATV